MQIFSDDNEILQKHHFFRNKKSCLKSLFNINIYIIIVFVANLFATLYLIVENKRNKKKINYLLELSLNKKGYGKFDNIKNKISLNEKHNLNGNNIINSISSDFSKINKDMVGWKYPDILFDELRKKLINNEILPLIKELLNQLEIKLIFLEKEINITKLVSFYTSRKIYLEKNKIDYNDNKVEEIHNIISWTVIHKTTPLKGIASDKYLACKYVEYKLGENLCQQRIGVYKSVEEINFKNITELGNIAIKISNGCGDTIFIYKNKSYNFEIIKEKIQKNLNKDYGIENGEFFHLYSKKRIVVEKMFSPLTDLYEFKFYVVNNNVKLIYIRAFYNRNIRITYFDKDYNLLIKDKEFTLDISRFDKSDLNKLKDYAIKLSEDFPNFIRVDLYLFHNKIYLSELTFDPQNGFPFLRYLEIIKNAAKNWKRIDN